MSSKKVEAQNQGRALQFLKNETGTDRNVMPALLSPNENAKSELRNQKLGFRKENQPTRVEKGAFKNPKFAFKSGQLDSQTEFLPSKTRFLSSQTGFSKSKLPSVHGEPTTQASRAAIYRFNLNGLRKASP
jgi:hypothetical protein